MGFLGQELPGSIIGAECTCSHMPVAERSRAYLRPHAFPHPPPGTRGLWAAARRGSLHLAAQKWGAEGPRTPRVCSHSGCCGCSPCVPALPAAPRVALGSCSRQGMLSVPPASWKWALHGPSPGCCPSGSIRNVWGFQSSVGILTSPFLPGVFPDLSEALKSRAGLGSLFSLAPAHPRLGTPTLPGFTFLRVLSPTPS